MFQKVISASLSPNTSSKDVRMAWHVLFRPWTWKEGTALTHVADWFKKTYSVSDVFLFQSGRVALCELLESFDIGKGDEVLVQAFSCVAVANSVRWAGATPVYVDIDDSLNMDPSQVSKKMTSRTKALVIQHTFGIPADITELLKVATKHNLIVIEDCAHALGSTYNGKPLGSFGDAAFFSFGRDKAVSSVWGGAAIIHTNHRTMHAIVKLQQRQNALPMPGYFWIKQQLLHPVAFSVILPLYHWGIGKVLLVTLQKFRLLSKPVALVEYVGGEPPGVRTKYPNALAQLLMVQLHNLPEMIKVRQKSAKAYHKELPGTYTRIPVNGNPSHLRYPLFVSDPQIFQKFAKRYGVYLGNWYHNIIDPSQTDFGVIGYKPGMCPKAEKAAAKILNVPTLLSDKDTQTVIRVLKQSVQYAI